MNSKPVTACLLALSLAAAAAAPAFAQGRPDDRGPHGQMQRGPDHRADHRSDYRPGYRPGPSRMVRGAGPRHDIYRGQRLPAYYRGHNYVVNNWRVHRLAPPPRGYYWVQTGADYLLVAVATGLIAQIVLQ